MMKRPVVILAVAACWLGLANEAAAQLDPLLFIRRVPPNVLIAVDTANRMQNDPEGRYVDANVYTRTGALWESSLGIPFISPPLNYRRRYVNLTNTDPVSSGGDKFAADKIEAVLDTDPAYATFDERTKISVARRALIEAIGANTTAARFSLFQMRQRNPRLGAEKNEGPVKIAHADQQANTETGSLAKWKVTRTIVDATNGALGGPVAPLTAADAVNASSTILATLAKKVGEAGALTPAGRDAVNIVDAPIDNMLDDVRAEAVRLINADTVCRNTVAILVVGGGEGSTTNEDIAAEATSFTNVGPDRRVPIHVIAITPPAADVPKLMAVAANSGGVYIEITAAMINAVPAGEPVPEFVRALNFAVQHAFAETSHFNTDPTPSLPIGPYSEFQVTSPIVGTVNLENAFDINNNPLPDTIIKHPATGVKIPQRSNVMLTTGFTLPGFDATLRAFRVYKPEVDATKPAGFKFIADGSRLWVAKAPAAVFRNIYTALPDGTMVPFNAASAGVLKEFLGTTDPEALIEFVRNQPLGGIVGSTPALLDAPSLDPPPDSDYPGFADANKARRSMVWVGANDGMLHGIDARLGIEVWAYIPFNLLPKLKTLLHGQPVGSFRYFVDSSPKVADVKVAGEWRTYLIIGEGAGGTFYQTLDVTLDDMATFVAQDDNDITNVLGYFSDPVRVPLKWAFPEYSHFDHTIAPWGDIAAAAPAVSKTVGQTWSDPAVGQVGGPAGKYVVLTGSGAFPFTQQQKANRGGIVAGSTFYALDVETGGVFDYRSVGSDNIAEGVDNCQVVNDCTKMKNALQADPVATGPADSRFITKAYMGDLDGRLWRFDIVPDAMLSPKFTAHVKLFDAGAAHPMFASMATVNVGATKQYLFQGTGSDLLPSNGVSVQYKLLVILDNGASGTKTAELLLEKTDGIGNDEKVTAFPAVAGDIVFFTTTTFKPATPCVAPDANLYAATFIGGAAYDTNGSGSVTAADKQKVMTVAGARATAPFIVDQHLVFAAGNKLQMFGDPEDFNNGVGQAGVRILSWREVR